MKQKPTLALLFGAIALAVFSFILLNITPKSSPPTPKEKPYAQPNSLQIALDEINPFMAWEENRPPLGIPVDPNRDTGFASIFLSIKNPEERIQSVTITSIEIKNIDGTQEQFPFEPRTETLQPLENRIIDIHLTNKTGYLGAGKVQIIVHYTLGEKTYTLTSDPVQIDEQGYPDGEE